MLIGEYLKDLFRNKNLSAANVVKMTGIKHRNIIYRLFNGELSFEKTIDVVSKIKNNISFTDKEIETIDKLLKQSRKGTFYVKSREILYNLYKENLPCDFKILQKDESISLYDLLCNNSSGEMFIYLYNIDDVRMIGDLYKFMSCHDNIKVYHTLQFKNQSLITAYEILGVLELAGFENYMPLYGNTELNTQICVLKKENDQYYINLLEKIGKKYTVVNSKIGIDFYIYLRNKYATINNTCKKLKKNIRRISDLIEFLQISLNFDKNDCVYSEGGPCFSYLPLDVIYELFIEANFYGIPIEHDIPQKLMALLEERQKLLSDGTKKKRLLFDVNHLENVLKTGYAVYHLDGFKPMTINQRKRVFEDLLKYANDSSSKINIKVLNNLSIRTRFVYQINGILCEYCWDYNEPSKVSVLLIENQIVNDLMNDFMDFVWEEYTLSCAESAALINSLVDKWLNGTR